VCRALTILQAASAAVALRRLARGRRRMPPPLPGGPAPDGRVSVVIPARHEAGRIGPCLAGAGADPSVDELVVVVDADETDDTAGLAAAAGARVVVAPPLPDGWVGKPWACQQGLEAARGDYVIQLDADTRPRPGFAAALMEQLRGADLVTAGTCFICETAGERLLHPALLATLVYRFGPTDTGDLHPSPARAVANGQCLAFRRADLLAAGGFAIAREHMNDDIALVRALAAAGWRLRFVDGAQLISVRMQTSASEVWREWSRSLAMQDTTTPAWLALDLAVVWLVLALPVLRLATRRLTPIDRALLAVRAALLVPVARSYERRGIPYWLSPLADPAASLCLTLAGVRPRRSWRGREYGRPSDRRPAAGPPRGSAPR
jgi:dolichol-phosphate mannosyltransferase